MPRGVPDRTVACPVCGTRWERKRKPRRSTTERSWDTCSDPCRHRMLYCAKTGQPLTPARPPKPDVNVATLNELIAAQAKDDQYGHLVWNGGRVTSLDIGWQTQESWEPMGDVWADPTGDEVVG